MTETEQKADGAEQRERKPRRPEGGYTADDALRAVARLEKAFRGLGPEHNLATFLKDTLKLDDDGRELGLALANWAEKIADVDEPKRSALFTLAGITE